MKCATIMFLFPALLWAQDFQFQLETNTIPIQMENWDLYCPWAGGVVESNPEFGDLDGDGDLDLVIGSSIYLPCFINDGVPSQPFFSYAPDLTSGVQTIGWTAPDLCDIDDDGDLDVFATSDERVWFWENVGSPQMPQWQFVTDSLEQIVWWAINLDFVDIDADGDLDLFTGSGLGTVRFYRNQGTPSNFNLFPENIMVGNIDVGNHSDPNIIDIDADGDYDLFIGNSDGNIWYYRNDGDSLNYNFTYVTSFFDSIDVGEYASPEFADIDGDGDYDLFIGREVGSTNYIGDLYVYENVGTPQDPQFIFVTRDYLVLDLGGYYYSVKPALADLNANGTQEFMVGTANLLDYFENIGDSINAIFLFDQEGYQNIMLPGVCPFLADLDGDGDHDMICGESALPGPPSISLYANVGTQSNAVFQLYSENFVTNPNFFVCVYPALVDIDADGDYDMFIFDGADHFYYYQNMGSIQWPNYVLITNQWQGIHQFPYPYDGWYGFTFGDLDDDMDQDLLIRSPYRDNLYLYQNNGTPQNPIMVLATTQFLDSAIVAGISAFIDTPVLVDIDSDGDLDLFVGDTRGGFRFFRNVTGEPAIPPLRRHPQAGLQLTLGPNPANPVTWVTFHLPAPQKATLAVYNLLGQRVATLAQGLQPPGAHTYLWNAAGFASGVYVVRLEMERDMRVEKIVVLR